MITLIIKSYLAILLPVGIGSLLMLVAGFYWILKKNSSAPQIELASYTVSDLHAIAGDDVMATQLDLARAYIETDKKDLAKKILNTVIKNGSVPQQDEAQRLLSSTI